MDAKLARTAKARAVAQTAFYSQLLAALQGVRPRWMHLALGQGDLTSLRVGDYAADERQARRALGRFIDGDPGHNPPTDPYPEPVEHCVICRWDDLCKDRRRRDDDLSLVAGITKDQRRALKAAGVSTRRGLADLALLPGGNRVSQQSLEGARLQARLQVASEDEGRIQYELLDPERDVAGALLANRGLLALSRDHDRPTGIRARGRSMRVGRDDYDETEMITRSMSSHGVRVVLPIATNFVQVLRPLADLA